MPHAVKKHVFKNIKANIFSALKIDILPEISKNNILNVLTECRTQLRFFITKANIFSRLKMDISPKSPQFSFKCLA